MQEIFISYVISIKAYVGTNDDWFFLFSFTTKVQCLKHIWYVIEIHCFDNEQYEGISFTISIEDFNF